jgi:hypothetical protein
MADLNRTLPPQTRFKFVFRVDAGGDLLQRRIDVMKSARYSKSTFRLVAATAMPAGPNPVLA